MQEKQKVSLWWLRCIVKHIILLPVAVAGFICASVVTPLLLVIDLFMWSFNYGTFSDGCTLFIWKLYVLSPLVGKEMYY